MVKNSLTIISLNYFILFIQKKIIGEKFQILINIYNSRCNRRFLPVFAVGLDEETEFEKAGKCFGF